MLEPTRHPTEDFVEAGYWRNRTLSSFLMEAVDRRPDYLALSEAGTRLSYSELGDVASRFAQGLQNLGVAQHDVVTVELPNWWEAAVVFHALAWGGYVCNPVVPIYRHAELTFILRQAETRAIVIPHRFRGFDYVEMVRNILPDLQHSPVVVVVRPERHLPDGFIPYYDVVADAGRPPAGAPDDICLLLYTSGTTSDPKGVLHNHQTIVWEMDSIIALMGLTSEDRTFMPSPVGHLTGIVYGVYLPTLLMQSTTLLDQWDPSTAVDVLEGDGCTFSLGATPFLRQLVDEYTDRQLPSSLRTFLCGGADVPPELIRQARQSLSAVVSRSYGSSEMPVYSTCGPGHDVELAAETDGLPIPPGEGYLMDEESGVGELVVRGPELFLGYLDETLNPSSFTEDGYFKTGDLARITSEGAIVIEGRKKDIIIRAGENVSATQVEHYLLRHGDISDVAVVSMPDARLGEKACAFVVPKSATTSINTADLFEYLRGEGLAAQKCPEHVEMVEDLPRTPSGKVQKFLLRERAREIAKKAGSA